MDSAIAQALARSKPRMLAPAELADFEEIHTRRLPASAAAWLAPLSPSLTAASSAAAAAELVPPSVVAGLPHGVAMDQVVRRMPTAHVPESGSSGGDGDGGGASGDDPLGPMVSVSSALQLPISVEDGFVCGLVATDVVLDTVRLVGNADPLMRVVYDVEADTVVMSAAHRGRSLVTAACGRMTPDRDALTMTVSVFQRPAQPGEPVRLLLRLRTIVSGAAPLAPIDLSSPLAAYRSAICRMVGSFGAAAVVLSTPGGGGGGPPGVDGGADASDDASISPIVSNVMATEYSSAAVVTRLQALLMGRRPVHPGGLWVRPPAAVPIRPSLGRDPAMAPLLAPAVGAAATGPQPWPESHVVATRTPSAPRTRGRVRLEEVEDATVRARIIRNRAAAQRSNAKRRAARAAGQLPAG